MELSQKDFLRITSAQKKELTEKAEWQERKLKSECEREVEAVSENAKKHFEVMRDAAEKRTREECEGEVKRIQAVSRETIAKLNEDLKSQKKRTAAVEHEGRLKVDALLRDKSDMLLKREEEMVKLREEVGGVNCLL